MKEKSGYMMALEKGIEAWTEFLGGRLVFRVKNEGKINTFSSDSSLGKWVVSL